MKTINKQKFVSIFIPLFYSVGLFGMLNEFSRPFFQKLTPLALILSAVFLVLYDREKKIYQSTLIFSLIFLFGLLIEIVGVKTGLIFGDYIYGSSLGVKVFDAPILIGLNWVLLVYTSSSVLSKIKTNTTFKIFAGASIMLIYDLVLEQVAPKIAMWSWSGNSVPFQNYVAWFLIAIVFHTLVKVSRTSTSNPLSLVVILTQFLFFVVLSIFLP